MKSIVLSALLGGIAVFVFGAVYWMSPLPKMVIPAVKDDAAIQQVLREQIDASGTYVIPNMNQEQSAFMEKHKAGPNLVIHFNANGMGPEAMGPMMAKGFAFSVFTALILALLTRMVVGSLPGYGDRVKFATLVGLVAFVLIDLGNMNWWFVSPAFTFLTGAYHVLSFAIAGLVIAKFVRPEEKGTPAPAVG